MKPRRFSFSFPLRAGRPFLVGIQEMGKENPFVRGDFDSPLTRRYQRFNKIQRKCFCAYPPRGNKSNSSTPQNSIFWLFLIRFDLQGASLASPNAKKIPQNLLVLRSQIFKRANLCFFKAISEVNTCVLTREATQKKRKFAF